MANRCEHKRPRFVLVTKAPRTDIMMSRLGSRSVRTCGMEHETRDSKDFTCISNRPPAACVLAVGRLASVNPIAVYINWLCQICSDQVKESLQMTQSGTLHQMISIEGL